MNEEKVTNEMVSAVYQGIEKCGLIGFLDGVIGKNIRMRLYIPMSLAAEPCDVLQLGTRGSNALKRCRCLTVGDVADLIGSGELSSVRNLGRKSVSEIKTEMLHKVWAAMDRQSRLRFCRDLIALNFECAGVSGAAKRNPA